MYVTFRNITVPLAAKKDHIPVLRSWRTLYARIKRLEANDASLVFLAQLLACELANPDGPRAHMLSRLHMRFNRMRQQLEFSQVIRHATR